MTSLITAPHVVYIINLETVITRPNKLHPGAAAAAALLTPQGTTPAGSPAASPRHARTHARTARVWTSSSDL